MSATLDAQTTDDQDLLTARYGAADVPATGPVNDVIRALFAHRSVRGYLPTALPSGTVETLVAAAQSAASQIASPTTKFVMPFPKFMYYGGAFKFKTRQVGGPARSRQKSPVDVQRWPRQSAGQRLRQF